MGSEKGLDTATVLTSETINTINKTNYSFVVRYYATNPNLPKVMKVDEAKRISESGMLVIAVFQNYNNNESCFSKDLGGKNAKAAYEYAKKTIKQPLGTPIYFAVDYDASDKAVKSIIKDYFEEIKTTFIGLGNEYKIGVYGSGAVCKHIKDDNHIADYSWLSMSTGHRGSKDYKNWDLHQQKSEKINGVSFDSNETGNNGAIGAGGWKLR